MGLRIRIVLATVLVFASSFVASGVAAAQPDRAEEVTVVTAQVTEADFGIMGSYLEDCYYSGGYRGCSYFYGNSDPEVFRVCDWMNDGRYTKGRIKFGGSVYEVGPVGDSTCADWAVNILESVHLGIHTGVEGLGWTEYEYGYA